MINLLAIFSDNALYQQNSMLDIRGKCDPKAKVYAEISRDGNIFSSNEAVSSDDGAFTVSLRTPAASFDEYSIKIKAGNDEKELKNILFGELWLAAGQSNMEMANHFVPGHEKFFERADKCKNFRYYRQKMMKTNFEGPFPYEPDDSLDGHWSTSQNREDFREVSACASMACVLTYEYLNQNAEVPVGFLNITVGGTFIETWLSKDAIDSDQVLVDYLKKHGRYPDKEKWDTHAGLNFIQSTALYNMKVWPAVGVKIRGILWYQGETNVASRESGLMYERALDIYYNTYRDLFKSEGEETFPMICSQVYPWMYDVNDLNCRMGFVNQVFTDMAEKYPDRFAVTTIYDLPPAWAYGKNNHPIHPTHKYELGERLGELMMTNTYGKKGLKSVITMKKIVRKKGGINVVFNTGRRSLETTVKKLRGFYICGADNFYVEADAKIVSKNTVFLSHPYIPRPKEALYQFSNMDMSGRLYCGGLPVAPFASDRVNKIRINPKPFTHTETDSVWVTYLTSTQTNIDSTARPTFFPSEGCSICHDYAFTLNAGSLRIRNAERGKPIAAYTVSYPHNTLDLYNYKGMRFVVFGGRKEVTCKVKAYYADEEKVYTFNAKREEDISVECAYFTVKFKVPEKKDAEKLEFIFTVPEEQPPTVAIDDIVMIPAKKKAQ